jgi:predicted RND superfamily exporter protein
MQKIAEFIVKHRWIMLFIFALLMVYSVWGITRVEVEYSITAYLPQETDTRIALDIMDEEFVTYGTTTIMVRNVSYKEALALHDEIEEIDGVKSFPFKNTPDYYKDSCALFNITYDGTDEDEVAVTAYEKTLEVLEEKDTLISVPFADSYADKLQTEINYVLLLSVLVIIAVLLLTSQSFAEVPVFLITFGVSALLNMGTNYWFGTISFISKSVCVILQLALAIDYAIILCHRFAAAKQENGGKAYEGMITALSKAIPEICSSSLTTIAGLLALATMSLRLGADLGFVLAKSILCSMLTVFLLMPSLILTFNKPIEKTTHKNLIPPITPVGKFNIKFRYVLIAVFVLLSAVGGYLSFQTDYVYSSVDIDTSRPTDKMVAKAETEEIFGKTNQFVILVPRGDYTIEKNVLDMVEAHEEISEATGLSNVEISSNGQTYYLTEEINYKQFALLLGTTESISSDIFTAYAFFSGEDSRAGLENMSVFYANRELYTASVLDMCDCAFAHDDFISAYLYDDPDTLERYEDVRDTILDAEDQLRGTNYTRLVFNLDLEVESKETFAFFKSLEKEVKAYCPNAVFAGDSMSAYDLDQSFSTDNFKVTLLTVLFVFVILMFTFRSWGLPIPLTLTIQGAIFLNFSYYALTGTNLFFFVYLIVSSIQMGATIDYAIVITNHYRENKKTADKNTAMIRAINESFPTIFTSGTIMAVAAFLIGFLVSDPLISTLGICLGRGVIISILSVLFVLPALLIVFDKPIEKTMFKERKITSPFELVKQGRKRIVRRTVLMIQESNKESKADETEQNGKDD